MGEKEIKIVERFLIVGLLVLAIIIAAVTVQKNRVAAEQRAAVEEYRCILQGEVCH